MWGTAASHGFLYPVSGPRNINEKNTEKFTACEKACEAVLL